VTDLFSNTRPDIEEIYPDIFVLPNFAETSSLLNQVEKIIEQAPFRKMMTPIGHYTGIALTNCGEYGWTSDAEGYRYSKLDPQTNNPWPSLPASFSQLANRAASRVAFQNFKPDACLINQYFVGNKLGSHQDKNEQDFSHPIVSISIGLPAIFQVFGATRAGIKVEYLLQDGDVMVWGRSARLTYHGVKTIRADKIDPLRKYRINITMRTSR